MTSSSIVSALEAAYISVLGRPPESTELPWAEQMWAQEIGGAALLEALVACDEHQNLVHGARFVPPGHFYSPQPSEADIDELEQAISAEAATASEDFPGIDLRADAQLELLGRFAAAYDDLPFEPQARSDRRYHYENPNYSYSDAIFLASVIREARPQRFIEVGSGDSSCALLDINDRFFNSAIDITFIEPYPAYLNSLLGPAEARRIRMLANRLQDVDLKEFQRLEHNDILFIDSTHVAKAGSDVNHLLFEILPQLKPGVYVHIHDVFGSFEYPLEWLREGRAWNEQYMLRAFLQYNTDFEIVLFGNWAVTQYSEWFAANMPLCLKNPGGSLWLRRR